MGLSPWSSPYALYHRKTGDLPEQEDTTALSLGRYLEAWVAGAFAERHPKFGVAGDGRTLFAHLDRPWQLATPDRIIYNAARISGPNLAVLECKTSASYDDWGDDGTDQIPVHYRAQVLWQMDVMDVTAGYVACLFLHSRKLRVYELTMDHVAGLDVLVMRGEAIQFLERIDRKEPPGVDWRPATRDTLTRLHPDLQDRQGCIGARTAISYKAAVRRHKEAGRRKDEMTNRVLAAIGSGRKAVTWRGEHIATRQVYDLPEKTITRKASTVRKLVPAREKQT